MRVGDVEKGRATDACETVLRLQTAKTGWRHEWATLKKAMLQTRARREIFLFKKMEGSK